MPQTRTDFIEEGRKELAKTGLTFSEAESIATSLAGARSSSDVKRWADERSADLVAGGMAFAEAAAKVSGELVALGLWGAYSGDASAAFTGSERRGATLPQPRTPEQAERDTERVYAAARDLQKQEPGLKFHEAIDRVIRDRPELYGLA